MSDSLLDITPYVCPMTFVRAKLHMEALPDGAVTRIKLKGSEPLQNVPRSLREQGYEVVEILPEDAGDEPDTVHVITVRKPAKA